MEMLLVALAEHPLMLSVVCVFLSHLHYLIRHIVIVIINYGQSATTVTDGHQRPNDGAHQQGRNRFVQAQWMLENDCEVSNNKTEYYYRDHVRNNY
jgi:hypothetical protein